LCEKKRKKEKSEKKRERRESKKISEGKKIVALAFFLLLAFTLPAAEKREREREARKRVLGENSFCSPLLLLSLFPPPSPARRSFRFFSSFSASPRWRKRSMPSLGFLLGRCAKSWRVEKEKREKRKREHHSLLAASFFRFFFLVALARALLLNQPHPPLLPLLSPWAIVS